MSGSRRSRGLGSPDAEQAHFGDSVTITQNGVTAGTLSTDAPGTASSYIDGIETPKHGTTDQMSPIRAADPFDVNEFDFYVRDPDGFHYDPTSLQEPSFSAVTLNAKGEKASGYITFDAPGHGTLIYVPNYDKAALVQWAY